MNAKHRTRSAQIREQLDHPIVDGDGHWIEFLPVFAQYLREYAGDEVAEKFDASRYFQAQDTVANGAWMNGTLAERRDGWQNKSMFWSFPTKNTLDRATAMLPKLMANRLDDMGIDVSILYPTHGMHMANVEDPEITTIACQAFNAFTMELIGPYGDRMIPVAIIPMETPDQAIEALDHAVNALGFKAALFQQYATRPIPKLVREGGDLAEAIRRPDFYGLDSAHDYDTVWKKCVDLKVAVTFHAIGRGNALASRLSISNYTFNRLGALAAQHHRLAAALFLGGVTRRFPDLNIAFLEGGVSWACALYADIVGIWGKRNLNALEDLKPSNLDVDLLFELIEKYADERTLGQRDALRERFSRSFAPPDPADMDDYAALGVEQASDLASLFSSRYYFGCEGDDALNAMAFHSEMLPYGVTLKAFYGSDISHWDVRNMEESLEEAYEPLEDGVITPEQFREFVYENPVQLHATMNPDFFVGTRVEKEVAQLLSAPRTKGTDT